MRHTQEEIHRSRSEYTDSLDRVVHGLQEEFAGLNQQLTTTLSMFVRQPNVSLPTDFPPRTASTPILTSPINRPQPPDSRGGGDPVELGEGMNYRNYSGNNPIHAGLRMEISAFDRDKPRWWIRRCERVFYQHRIAEGDKVCMVASYLDDVADA